MAGVSSRLMYRELSGKLGKIATFLASLSGKPIWQAFLFVSLHPVFRGRAT
jgi:hypothetical protein